MKRSKLFMPELGFAYGYLFPIVAIVFFLALFAISTINVVYRTRYNVGLYIADEVAQLKNILEEIDKTADILSFDYQQNPINFLQIKKDGFVSSEVGSMNLAHPEKWDGPYLQDSPVIQGKEYMVVRTNSGYFITPGDGVTLPSGKVIGKDVILDENADIISMMKDPQIFFFKGKMLAAPLNINNSPLEGFLLRNYFKR